MTPISFTWDTRKRSACVKWNGLLSFEWENGKVLKRILRIPIPFGFRGKRRKIDLSMMRWIDLKEMLFLLKKWDVKKVEASFSFPDPMVNGLLYGCWSAVETEKLCSKIDLNINFIGENWCSGEVTISPKRLFYHLRRILPLLTEMRGRRPEGGGG